MGLKFKQDNILDQKFGEFAFLPDEDKNKKDEKQDLERFLHPKSKKDKEKILSKKIRKRFREIRHIELHPVK